MNPASGLLAGVRQIAHGFLFGIGLCIAVAGAAYISRLPMKTHATMIDDGNPAGIPAHSAKDLVLSNVKEQKNNGATVIIGEITNSGKTRESSIRLQVNFFLHGAYVDQYSSYLGGALEPGATQYFKIECGCKDTPPADHDSYKVEITRSY